MRQYRCESCVYIDTYIFDLCVSRCRLEFEQNNVNDWHSNEQMPKCMDSASMT